mmetsp:Transcript_13499/g.33095  ORF Transcript_13499/g.33095 Transcript_13499/m.33095 type:complete len:105 (-) Transcript_13499:191-505(-)
MMMMGPDHRRPPQRIAGQVLHHRHSSSVLMSNEHRHLGVLSADDVATVAGNQLVHLYLLSIWASAGTRVSERQPLEKTLMRRLHPPEMTLSIQVSIARTRKREI